MPGLVKLLEKYPRDLVVIGVHAGKGTPKDVSGALDKLKIPYPVVQTKEWDALPIWGLTAIPRLVLVDREGKVHRVGLGPEEGELEAERLIESTSKRTGDGKSGKGT